MFQIKICGITNGKNAQESVLAGADAVGFNFYERSPRFVHRDVAAKIVAALPEDISQVGVFVNSTAVQIASCVESLGLNWVQLHGEEPPEQLTHLPRGVSIIRAVRCGSEGLKPLASYLASCQSHGRLPDAVLIDAHSKTEYGGTGRLADWQRIIDERAMLSEMPLILAGGLTPENVGEAISSVNPTAVDVASGVERKPGVKDPDLVAQFVMTARAAFERSS